jgi:hypothetical protein
LVQRLSVRGPETDTETVKSIIAKKEEALPHLVRVATEEKYWDTESGLFSVWAPSARCTSCQRLAEIKLLLQSTVQ